MLQETVTPLCEPICYGGPITAPKVFLVLAYGLLGVVWIIIAWEVWTTVWRMHAPLGLEQTRRRLLTAGLVVSFSLAFDAGYWMIVTAGRYEVIPGHPEVILQEPIWNILEKLPLLVAAAAFLWTFYMTSRLTAVEIDGRYFSRFAERTLDAITLLDPQGRIQYWNKQAERMFGWDRDRIIGRRIQDLMVPPDRIEETEDILRRVRQDKRAHSLDSTERLTASNNSIYVSIDTAPILDPDFVGYFSIIRPALQRNPFANHPYFRESQLPECENGKVFVAVPFTVNPGDLNVWRDLLLSVADDLNLNLVRADQQLGAHGVVDQAFHDIASAELVIADLTGNNPNVYYEVGLAHALGIETLHILRTGETIPFNVRHLQIIYCDPGDVSKGQDDIRKAIASKRRNGRPAYDST